MRILGRIMSEASAGNQAGAKDAVEFLIREKDGFIEAVRAGRIDTKNLKTTAKRAIGSLHPDKGGDPNVFALLSNLVGEDNFGILTGKGKSRKCRYCGLPKY
jgi:hypothetical protein